VALLPTDPPSAAIVRAVSRLSHRDIGRFIAVATDIERNVETDRTRAAAAGHTIGADPVTVMFRTGWEDIWMAVGHHATLIHGLTRRALFVVDVEDPGAIDPQPVGVWVCGWHGPETRDVQRALIRARRSLAAVPDRDAQEAMRAETATAFEVAEWTAAFEGRPTTHNAIRPVGSMFLLN
jgi:hypothetical protein